MAEWIISPLDKVHDRTAFSCSKPSLDSFLQKQAMQYEKRRLARTFVATEAGSPRVAGYYTLAAGSLDLSLLPEPMRKKLPKHPIPTFHLARLAVDTTFRGLRLGEMLLYHALNAMLDLSDKVGAIGVDVWALDDQASAFYQKYGFVELLDNPHHLFAPMKTVEGMFQQ